MRVTLGSSEIGNISQSEGVQGTPEGGTHFTYWLCGFLEYEGLGVYLGSTGLTPFPQPPP